MVASAARWEREAVPSLAKMCERWADPLAEVVALVASLSLRGVRAMRNFRDIPSGQLSA